MVIKTLVSNSTPAPWVLAGRSLLLATPGADWKQALLRLAALHLAAEAASSRHAALALPGKPCCLLYFLCLNGAHSSPSRSTFLLVPGISTDPATLRVNEHAHNGKQRCTKKKSRLNTVCQLQNCCKSMPVFCLLRET